MKTGMMLSGACALALAATGCAAERSIENYDENDYELMDDQLDGEVDVDYEGQPSNLNLEDGTLRGTIGDVGVDNDGWIDGYADGEYASVYTTVDEAAGGAVMTIFDVEGGLAHTDLQPGTHQVYRPEDLYRSETEGAFVTVVGCAGPTSGAWEFDQTAEVVTVDVKEGPTANERVFEYTARFDDGYANPSVVSGAFTASLD